MTLAIIGALSGTSREKHHRELGFESCESTRQYRKLCCFCKVFKTQLQNIYLTLFLKPKEPYILRNSDKLPHFKVKQNYLNGFFPSPVMEWKKLDLNIRISDKLYYF